MTVALTIKPLEWRDHGLSSFPARTWSATTPFGFYEIEEESASDSPRYRLEWHSFTLISDEESLEAAKAAAQADFERRIRSCLTDAPPTVPSEEDELRAEVEGMRAVLAEVPDDFATYFYKSSAWAHARNIDITSRKDGILRHLEGDWLKPFIEALIALRTERSRAGGV